LVSQISHDADPGTKQDFHEDSSLQFCIGAQEGCDLYVTSDFLAV